MAVIHVLSPHVADMIAAGEVVERPGNAIKELMENAVDAGAKNITIELRGGGSTYIRVTDDGCGMAPDDAGNCFLRHATSKLRDETGLEAIETMGFRGEALAAISAVSRVDLVTRRAGDEAGTHIEVAGGDILAVETIGCPTGTVFTVRDIFYNTPARLKFMKSDRAEASFCVQTALRVALGHPEISIRCLRDGKEEFFTAGDGLLSSAVYSLLGRETAQAMLPVESASEGVSVMGFVSSPSGGRGSRSMQYFYVNGRPIRSQSLQAALEQAYKDSLLVGRYPACVLMITLSPGSVDVNVHPTKSEVKFSNEKRVFDAVYYGTLGALSGEEDTLHIDLSRGTSKRLEPVVPTKDTLSGEHAPAPAPAMTGTGGQTASAPPPPPAGSQLRMDLHSPSVSYGTAPRTANYVSLADRDKALPHGNAGGGRTAACGGTSYGGSSRGGTPSYTTVYGKPAQQPSGIPAAGNIPAAPAEEPIPPFLTEEPEITPPRVVGEVMKTYIIVEDGDRVLFIDKHAAHERMNFDRLKAAGREIMSQCLLTPVIWRPDGEQRGLIDANAALLSELGFQLEDFGASEVAVRGIPDTLDPAKTVAALEEICDSLRRGADDLARNHILATIACKSAIKAGWDTDPAELEILAKKVLSGEIRYCPHGRPVAVTMTKKDLDKEFKRLV